MQVNNTCQAGTRPVNILGAAGLADPEYGATGVYRVQFPNERPPDCPGPNYIVQDYTGEFSLVQSNNFTTMFLLSRNQHPDDKVIDVSVYPRQAGEPMSLTNCAPDVDCPCWASRNGFEPGCQD